MLVDLMVKYIGLPPGIAIGIISVTLCLTLTFIFLILPVFFEFIGDTVKNNQPRKPTGRITGVPPAEIFNQKFNCPEQGSKNCELRGCYIIGSCQLESLK
jgi:hypothetical protein